MKNLFTFLFALAVASAFSQTPIAPSPSDLKNMTPAPLNCKAAEDSMEKRIARAELSFYKAIKNLPGQYNLITINKTKYSKIDSPKGDPTVTFVYCYNNAMKKVLDSVFKVDFFHKSDSILNSYDKTGRGYRNADFPGGAAALQRYMDKNIALPKDSKPSDDDKSIRIYYSFLVDEKGKLSDFKLERSNCKACEELVLAAIKKMPAFIPAAEAGVPKKIRYILPYTKS